MLFRQLLDLVVGALCQNEKRDNANGYNTMKTVIASCENHFQPFLGRELEKVVLFLCYFVDALGFQG